MKFNKKDHATELLNGSLSDLAESLTLSYKNNKTKPYRKKRGQFFTPKEISQLMVSHFEYIENKKEVRILDPGAGLGIFESTICDYLLTKRCKIKKIFFYLYENDKELLPYLNFNIKQCKKRMSSNKIIMDYRINSNDFILSNKKIIKDEKEKIEKFDYVICNPPYFKIKKNSVYFSFKNDVNFPPNIYPLFMFLCAKLLKDNGTMTLLTPRSYCSGWLYRNFRKMFFSQVKPFRIHLFESRVNLFKNDNVIQENVILSSIKTGKNPKFVNIDYSDGIPDEIDLKSHCKINYNRIIVERDNNIMVRIPLSKTDDQIAKKIDKFELNLKSLGFKVSTGPVVPFRHKNSLSTLDTSGKNVPLIWMHNIINESIQWPVQYKDKPISVINDKRSSKILVPNDNYVLIKRFSTKEGRQRINAGIYFKRAFKLKSIGIENHVNYIHKLEGKFEDDELIGLTTILNSKLYNKYLQITNGCTQVNASEIERLPVPSLNKIVDIGREIRINQIKDNFEKELIVNRILEINNKY